MNTEKTNTKCPYCKEEIRPNAVKCKHCYSKLAVASLSHEGKCPYCKEEIHKKAIKCKHCQSLLTAKFDCECKQEIGFLDLSNTSKPFIDSDLLSASERPTEFDVLQRRFPSTLPKCRWVPRICGSSLPGYPPIICGYDYVCKYGGQDTIINSNFLAHGYFY